MATKVPGKPIDPRTQARAAELVGMGLSQREAAGACGISESSVERLLRKPEMRKIADDVRRRRTSVTAQAASVVQDLLTAVDDKGEPSMHLRKLGAELVMKNPTLLEGVEEVDGDDALLPGVVLRFPWGGAPSEVEPASDGVQNHEFSSEADAPKGQLHTETEIGNGITLEEPNGSTLPAPTPGETLNLRYPDEVIPASMLPCGHRIEEGCECAYTPLFTEDDLA